MTAEDKKHLPRPIVPFLRLPENEEPYLVGSKCTACGEIFTGERKVCANCGGRDCMKQQKLSNQGELFVYSIVHRSLPGVKTPFISAVVDLKGGGTVKGTLINIEPVPETIRMGMPVEVIYRDAEITDAEGNPCIAFYFQPATAEAAEGGSEL